MNRVYLSMGSNLQDRLTFLAAAVSRLEDHHTRLVRVSSVYETAPQGKTDQPDFLNIAAEFVTTCEPAAFLAHMQAVERSLGRERKERWGPRTVDIDLLLFGQERLNTPDLEVPHPRMTERAFVLVPLLEINPDLTLPDGTPLHAYLEKVKGQEVSCILGSETFLRRVRGVQ